MKTGADHYNGFGDDVRLTVAVSAAPEPGTWALMFGGLAMIGGMLRLGRKRQVGSLSVA